MISKTKIIKNSLNNIKLYIPQKLTAFEGYCYISLQLNNNKKYKIKIILYKY